MAATGTPTPNLGLRIPLGTDPASVDDINYNSNALDTIIGDVGETPVAGQLGAANNRISAVQAGLAIVCNGNTHAAIESGQFAYVKNHGTLAEGLYRNNTGSTIAANATLSSSNLTADSSGGLNTVYDSLNSNVTNKSRMIVLGNDISSPALMHDAIFSVLTANGQTGTVYFSSGTLANLTNNEVTGHGSAYGTVYRPGSDYARFDLTCSNGYKVTIEQSSMSTSSYGTSTIYSISDNIAPVSNDKKFTRSSATTHTFTIPAQSSNILILSGNGGSRQFVAYIFRASGNSSVGVIYSSAEITWTESQGTLTITFESAGAIDGRCVNTKGDPIT